MGDTLRLFVGDDWAEDHHDAELMDATGRRLAKARLPEGVAGIARLHAMIGEQLGEDADEEDAGQVAVGIETDRGPWVAALIAAGYTVYAINPLQSNRIPILPNLAVLTIKAAPLRSAAGPAPAPGLWPWRPRPGARRATPRRTRRSSAAHTTRRPGIAHSRLPRRTIVPLPAAGSRLPSCVACDRLRRT